MLGHKPFNYLPLVSAMAVALGTISQPVLAGNGFTHTGAASTFRGAANGQSVLSNSSNPAAVGFDRSRMQEGDSVVGGVYIGGGIEYGNVQELFDVYDELSSAIGDSDDGGSGGGGGGNGGDSGLEFGNIDINDPDVAALIDRVKTEATRIGALLAVVAAEGYANGDFATEIPFVFNSDVFGGTIGFDLSYGGSASAAGFVEDLDFDADTARTELDAALNLQPGDPVTTYDLTGGISVTVDPNTGKVSGSFDNDSLLATRAAQETQLGVSYSYPIQTSDDSTLYLGAKAKFVRLGLSRVVTRIGDITNSEDLYDDIRNAEFINTNRFGMDFGALWVAPNVTLGAGITDAFEPTYEFNVVDTSSFDNPQLAELINDLQTYQQERQLTVEASVYTESRSWAISSSYEASAIRDALGEEHQWWNISGGWHSSNFWIPAVRVGYQQNLVGSEVGMYQLGFTLFRYVDLDFGMSSEDVVIDGSSFPRGASASIGFNYAF